MSGNSIDRFLSEAVEENQPGPSRRPRNRTNPQAEAQPNSSQPGSSMSSQPGSSRSPDNAILGDIIRQLAATVQRFDDRLQLVERSSSTRRIINQAAQEVPPNAPQNIIIPAPAVNPVPQNIIMPAPAVNPPGPSNLSKFKADVLFNGTGDLHPFLFAFNQTLESFDIQTPRQQLLAFGRSLRGDALSWWTLNSTQFMTLEEALIGIKLQYQDLVKPANYTRKLTRLRQTGSIREFFLEVDRLNVFAQLPEEALWKTLPLGLKDSLRVALASKWPQPESYTEWKKSALNIGASLDAVELPEMARRFTPLNVYRKQRCWKCGEEGHIGRECTKRENSENIRTAAQANDAQTTGEKRRRQGELHYPPTKKALTGELRVTVLDSDHDDDDQEKEDDRDEEQERHLESTGDVQTEEKAEAGKA